MIASLDSTFVIVMTLLVSTGTLLFVQLWREED